MQHQISTCEPTCEQNFVNRRKLKKKEMVKELMFFFMRFYFLNIAILSCALSVTNALAIASYSPVIYKSRNFE